LAGSRRRVGRRGIEIPADVAEGVALPEDLDAEVVAPHAVPDPQRRRRAAVVYVAAAALTALGVTLGALPVGMWLTVGFLLAVAGWYLLGAWHLVVREGAALEAANRAIGFPVGHASANLGFRGWRSRPIWNVLVFSADDPPSRRGLVRVDGIDGSIVETYAEDVPPGEW
jgi:hypothetical protein